MNWGELHRACFSGDKERVRVLVEGGADPESRDAYGHTPLHLACEEGQLEIVKYLAGEKHYKLFVRDDDGVSPLCKAVEHEQYDVVRFLVFELHCSLENLGVAILVQAFNHRDADFISYLKGKGPLTNDSGQGILHLACREGDLPLVKYIIDEHGFDPSILDQKFQTPLHLACKYDHVNIIEYLVNSKSCDINCTDISGHTPLHTVCMTGRLEVAKLLTGMEHCNLQSIDEAGKTPLHLAAGAGHTRIVHLLGVTKGCDANLKDMQGNTPLHCACKFGCLETVTLLLKELQCDPNSLSRQRKTPLQLTRDPKIIKILVQHGAQYDDAYQTYTANFPEAFPREPIEPVTRIFVLGNAGSGKSTLVTAISSERSRILGRIVKVPAPSGPTVVANPLSFESGDFGRVMLCDLAGRGEFFAAHDMLLQNTAASSPALFLLVVDLRQKDEEMETTLQHWTSFIKTHCSSPTLSSQCHIIVVGSHADQVKSRSMQSKHQLIDTLATTEVFSGVRYVAFVPLDCRYASSSTMKALRLQLKQSCNDLRPKTLLRFSAHCFLMYLLEKFPSSPIVSLTAILTAVKNTRVLSLPMHYFPDDGPSLSRILDHLCQRGNLLVVRGTRGWEESWVVLDPRAVLSAAIGSVLTINSPCQSTKATPTTATGLLAYSGFPASIPNLPRDTVSQFLRHLEFCQRVSDPKTLHLLQGDVKNPINESVFFFPGLVSEEEPDGVWAADNRYDQECGWVLQCSQSELFFTPRLLQVILMRLMFSFALAPSEQTESDTLSATGKQFSLWKNGLKWMSCPGVESLVQLTDKSVFLSIRCTDNKRATCEAVRMAVAEEVRSLQQRLAPKIACKDAMIDS